MAGPVFLVDDYVICVDDKGYSGANLAVGAKYLVDDTNDDGDQLIMVKGMWRLSKRFLPAIQPMMPDYSLEEIFEGQEVFANLQAAKDQSVP